MVANSGINYHFLFSECSFINKDTYEGQIDNPLSLNLYTYVENNPVRYTDPTGHITFDMSKERMQSLIVDARIAGPNNQSYWDIRSSLGVIFRGIIGDKNNNQFKYLFDMATMNSQYGNTMGHAIWAGEELLAIWEAYKQGLATEMILSLITRGASKTLKSLKLFKSACNCFTAGTKVLTDEGEKNIEDVKIGDKVLSKNEETGEVAYKEVTNTFNHETDEIYKIHVGDQVIESTYNHPFYVEGKGWTFVKDLKVGDLLVQSDGNTLKIESVELEHKHVTVYNMTVDEFHTYFVSDLGILVHNTKKCYTDFDKIKQGDNSTYKILSEETEWMKDQGMVSKGTINGRKTWFDGKNYYQWDSQHGRLEKWDKKQKNHLGEFDPVTGE